MTRAGLLPGTYLPARHWHLPLHLFTCHLLSVHRYRQHRHQHRQARFHHWRTLMDSSRPINQFYPQGQGAYDLDAPPSAPSSVLPTAAHPSCTNPQPQPQPQPQPHLATQAPWLPSKIMSGSSGVVNLNPSSLYPTDHPAEPILGPKTSVEPAMPSPPPQRAFDITSQNL